MMRSSNNQDRVTVEQGLDQLQIDADTHQINQLFHYVELLQKWSKVFNLIADQDRASIISHHLFDSVAIIPYLLGNRLVDVGSGAGLPGIPLAVLQTQRTFVLIDGNGKKTRFLQQVVAALELTNVQVVHERIENYQPKIAFDGLLSRAFASIYETIKMGQHLLTPQGQFQLMKSRKLEMELAQLPEDYDYTTIQLNIPQLNAERYLVNIMRK